MNLRACSLAAAGVFAAAFPAGNLRALPSDEAAAGRALSAQYSEAIVGVELVASIDVSVAGVALPPRRVTLEANGTVISPDGLTATSLIEVDPRRTAEAALRNITLRDGRQVQLGETQFKEVKLRLGNGAEIPAEMVKQDADLDLALFRPVAVAGGPKRSFAYVDLAKAADPVLLADYFVLSRGGSALGYVAEIHAATIEGVTDEPRRMFVPNGFATGCPFMEPTGRVLGLCLSEMVNGHPLMVGGHPAGVIVPASALVAALPAPQPPAQVPVPQGPSQAPPATAASSTPVAMSLPQ